MCNLCLTPAIGEAESPSIHIHSVSSVEQPHQCIESTVTCLIILTARYLTVFHQLVNREKESIEDNVRVQECLAEAKAVRKVIVRYVQVFEFQLIPYTIPNATFLVGGQRKLHWDVD